MQHDPPTAPQNTAMDKEDVSALAPLKMNPDDYKEIWADYELSDAQYNKLLEALWHIAQTFVLMGWNADISQIMLANLLKNSGPDSAKLLDGQCSGHFATCAPDNAEKESDDE